MLAITTPSLCSSTPSSYSVVSRLLNHISKKSPNACGQRHRLHLPPFGPSACSRLHLLAVQAPLPWQSLFRGWAWLDAAGTISCLAVSDSLPDYTVPHSSCSSRSYLLSCSLPPCSNTLACCSFCGCCFASCPCWMLCWRVSHCNLK